ncbi:MAG: protein kinase [Archangium sp.]|nr:protein kinase [Archangium sp.]
MYRLIGRIEQGQLADLFRGERVEAGTKPPGATTSGGETVVVKLFHLKTSDAGYAKVIADVARQLQSVSHPGVARVLDVGLINGQLAVVRQDTGKYSLGLALQRLNTREVFLPPALALTLSLELLDVVGAAHAAGVVHGALTPGNILLATDGRISVADFGALTALQSSPSLKKAFAGRGRGSYRAPELGSQDSATVASDLYTLGAIVYEVLTLREASTGSSNLSTRSERLPPPSRLVRRLHSRIDPVIMRTLENAAGRRPKSTTEFAEGIRDFLVSQGGIPPREDLQKFVGELFPNEVQMSALGPVPFDKPFDLTDISGVGSIEAEDVAVEERKSYSGGIVDERTPTSDGLPVFTEAMVAQLTAEAAANSKTDVSLPMPPPIAAPAPKPQPDLSMNVTMPLEPPPPPAEPAKRAVSDWEAPPAAMPVPAAAGPTAGQSGPTPQDPLKGRVRVVEDFAALEGQPKPEQKPMTRRQKVAKTIMTFAVPFKREGDPSIPSYEEMHRRGARQVRIVSFLATMTLFGVLAGSIYAFTQSTNDVKGTLVGYLPVPIQREIMKGERPPPPPPPKGVPPLKLADFDKLHPDKAFNPDGDQPKKVPAVIEAPPTPVVVPRKNNPPQNAPDCYDPPEKGKTAFLTVESSVTVRVEIDGRKVCTKATKVPVTAGSHKVVIVEPKTKQEYASTNRFEAGKVVKLMPVFQKR